MPHSTLPLRLRFPRVSFHIERQLQIVFNFIFCYRSIWFKPSVFVIDKPMTKPAEFVYKLYEILEDDSHRSIICWHED